MTEDTQPFTAEDIAELKATAARMEETGESYLAQLIAEYEARKLPRGHPDLPGWWLAFLRAWKPTNGPH